MPLRNKSRCIVCEIKCPNLHAEEGPEVMARNWYLYTIATKILKLKKHVVCQNFINYGIPQNWPEVKLCEECGRKLVTVMSLVYRALTDSDEDGSNDDIFRFLSNFDISVAVRAVADEGKSAAFDSLVAATDLHHKNTSQCLRNLVSRLQSWTLANQERENDEHEEYSDDGDDGKEDADDNDECRTKTQKASEFLTVDDDIVDNCFQQMLSTD